MRELPEGAGKSLADELEALAARATADTLMMYGEPDVGLRTEPFFGEPLKGNMRPLADWVPMDAELVVRLWNNLPTILSALRAREPSEDKVAVLLFALTEIANMGYAGAPDIAMRKIARAAIHAMENSDAG